MSAGLLYDPTTGNKWRRADCASELSRQAAIRRAPAAVLAELERARELSGPFEPRASSQSWQETIYVGTQDATQVSNTITETIMVPNFTLPAGYMKSGRTIKYTIYGRVGTVVTTPGTITFKLRWGGVGGTTMVTSKAQRPKVTASVSMAGWVEIYMVCRLEGLTGSGFAMGQCQLANTIGDAAAAQEAVWPDVPAAVTFDTTVAAAPAPTITFSVATSPTNWTSHMWKLEALN